MQEERKKYKKAAKIDVLADEATASKVLEQFANAEPNENPEQLDKATKELIIDFIAAKHGLVAKGAARRQIWEYAKSKMSSWDPLDPGLTHSAKLLRLISKDQSGKTAEYAEALLEHRLEEERQKQKKRGHTRKRVKPINDLLGKWIKKNPDISIDLIYERLENVVDEVFIVEVDLGDRTVSYRDKPEGDPKTLSEAALKTRVSRIRSKLAKS